MMENKGTNDVHTLLKALQTTIRFETEMSQRFDVKSLTKPSTTNATTTTGSSKHNSNIIDEKLKADGKLMYVPSYEQTITKEMQDDAYFLELMVMALGGGISGVFDKFLTSYVLLERSNLEELIEKLSREEDNAAEASGANVQQHVLESSMSMFVFIKNSIKRCTALSCGQTLLALTQVCINEPMERSVD
jgi:vacuolar protein sorting-associated protein 53